MKTAFQAVQVQGEQRLFLFNKSVKTHTDALTHYSCGPQTSGDISTFTSCMETISSVGVWALARFNRNTPHVIDRNVSFNCYCYHLSIILPFWPKLKLKQRAKAFRTREQDRTAGVYCR